MEQLDGPEWQRREGGLEAEAGARRGNRRPGQLPAFSARPATRNLCASSTPRPSTTTSHTSPTSQIETPEASLEPANSTWPSWAAQNAVRADPERVGRVIYVPFGARVRIGSHAGSA